MNALRRLEERLYRWLAWRRERRFAKWRKLHRVMMPKPHARSIVSNWPGGHKQ